MSILIDPYMFELTDEQEIRNNLSFFQKIIKCASIPENDKRLRISLYKGMVDMMQNRSIQPFPIQISSIKDRELKRNILLINQLFNNMLLGYVESIDVDECDGNQDFLVDEEKVVDDKYYDMFCTLLIPCYSNELLLDTRILTGIKSKGKQIGENCILRCGCETRNYSKKCVFVDISDFISPKESALDKIKEKLKADEIEVVDVVEATMGDHHNWVQADERKFQKLDDLSSQNKRVLNLLKEVGLYKIIFGRFLYNESRNKGTIIIQSLDEKDTQDILTVKFIAETEMVLETSLYFPKGIGFLLKQYFQKEQLIYKNVNELIEKIK